MGSGIPKPPVNDVLASNLISFSIELGPGSIGILSDGT